MKLSTQLAVLGAALCGLHVHVQSRALPGTSLSSREHHFKVEDITPLEKRNLLFGRAPVFTAPKPVPKPGAHGGSSGDSSASSPGSGGGDPATGGGVRIGADDSRDSSPGDSSDSSGGVRLGADNSGESTTGGHSGDTQPNIRLGAGDTSSGGNTGNHQTAQGPILAGGSKPGDNGILTIGESKDVGKLKGKGQKVDGELQQVIKDNKEDKATPVIDKNYMVYDRKSNQALDPGKAQNKDLVAPFKDLNVDLSKAEYNEYEVWSRELGEGAISIGRYFPKDGVIVGHTRFAEADKNPPANKMISSDQLFQQWKRANSVEGNEDATLEATKKLKGFIGRDIQSLSTIQTMQAMQNKVRAPLDRTTTFKRAADPKDKPDVQAAKKDAFDTMLGTDFISSLNYMLKDHSKALGKKQITEVTAYPRTYDPQTKSGMEKITIGIKFEEVK